MQNGVIVPRSIRQDYNKNSSKEANSLMNSLMGDGVDIVRAQESLKDSDYGSAYYHLLRATRHSIASDETQQYVKSVKSRLTLSESLQDQVLELSYTSGAFFWSMILIIALIFLQKSQLHRIKKLLVFASVFFIAVIHLAVPYYYVETKIKLFPGPSEIFVESGSIPEGKILLGTKDGLWFKVLLPTDYQGWVKIKDLKEL